VTPAFDLLKKLFDPSNDSNAFRELVEFDTKGYSNNRHSSIGKVLESALHRRLEEAMELIDLLLYAGFKETERALNYLSSSMGQLSPEEKEKLFVKLRNPLGSDI